MNWSHTAVFHRKITTVDLFSFQLWKVVRICDPASSKSITTISSSKLHVLHRQSGSWWELCACMRCTMSPKSLLFAKQRTIMYTVYIWSSLNMRRSLILYELCWHWSRLPNLKASKGWSLKGCCSSHAMNFASWMASTSCSIHLSKMLCSKPCSRVILGAKSCLNTLCFLSVGNVSIKQPDFEHCGSRWQP